MRTRGFYLPYGCGIDRDDLEQEAALLALSVAGTSHGYERTTVRHGLGMLLERELAQKRYPRGGIASAAAERLYSSEGGRRASQPTEMTCTNWRTIPSHERHIEEEVFVGEVLARLSDEARVIIRCRMEPSAKMRDFYEREDRPVPAVASYADISRHLGVSVASVMRAIAEARGILADA
jgi:hypothetical protein